MGIFSFNKKSDVVNAEQVKKRFSDVTAQIIERRTETIKKNTAAWQRAYDVAKDPYLEDRRELIDIYENIEIDSHVSSCVQIVTNELLQSELLIYNEAGEIDEEVMKFFDKQWFQDFVSIALESIYWGYSTIQLGEKKPGVNSYPWVKSVYRQNVIPEIPAVKLRSNDIKNSGEKIDLTKNPYKNWVIHVYPKLPGDQYRLGKFNKIAKLYIIKTEMIRLWASFNELFAAPVRVLKTDLNDDEQKRRAHQKMMELSGMATVVIGLHEELELVNSSSSSGDAHNNYKALIQDINKEISKCIIGATMINEDGSSRSQAEVHESTATANYEMIKKYLIEPVVNDQLIPLMRLHGFPIPEGHYAKYKDEDEMGKADWADMITKLSPYFDVPTDFVEQMTGVEVEDKSEPVQGTQLSNASNMASFYKNVSEEWQQHQDRYQS